MIKLDIGSLRTGRQSAPNASSFPVSVVLSWRSHVSRCLYAVGFGFAMLGVKDLVLEPTRVEMEVLEELFSKVSSSYFLPSFSRQISDFFFFSFFFDLECATHPVI